MTPKNICFYSASNELVGGDAKCMINIVNNLNLEEFNINIISDVNPIFERLTKNWLSKKIDIIYLNTSPKLFSTQIKFKIFRILFKLLSLYHLRLHIKNVLVFYKFFKNRNNIDIFHVNNGGYTGKQAALTSIIIAKYIGKVSNIVLYIQNVAKPKSILQPSDYIYDYFILKFCKFIVADSEITRKTLINRLGNTNKIITIRCGLDIQSNVSDKYKIISKDINTVKIGIIGNFEEKRKGHEYLINCLDKSLMNLNFHFYIAGSGSTKRKNELIKLLKNKKLLSKFTFLGFVDEVPKFLNTIDFVLMPSLYNESIPYAIMESLRSKKPVIASNVGSHYEAILNSYNGYIYKNANELNEALRLLIKNKDQINKMSRNAYDTFIDKFSTKNTSLTFIKMYRNLLNTKNV